MKKRGRRAARSGAEEVVEGSDVGNLLCDGTDTVKRDVSHLLAVRELLERRPMASGRMEERPIGLETLRLEIAGRLRLKRKIMR